MCVIRTSLTPGIGYTLEGSCGERLEFGVSEVLEPRRMPATACEEFRRSVLEVFGPGGSRRYPDDDRAGGLKREQAYDGMGGLGKRPAARVDDREIAAMFAPPARWR